MSEIHNPQTTDEGIRLVLSAEQKHDLKAALLAVKWAADLLQPADGSQPPCALLAEHLYAAHQRLSLFIDSIVAPSEGSSSC